MDVADMAADGEVEDMVVVVDMADSRVDMVAADMEDNREDMAAVADMEVANREDMAVADTEAVSNNRADMEVVADMEDINSLHTKITCEVYIKSI